MDLEEQINNVIKNPDIIKEIIIQVIRLKENECQNSGLNWLDSLTENL